MSDSTYLLWVAIGMGMLLSGLIIYYPASEDEGAARRLLGSTIGVVGAVVLLGCSVGYIFSRYFMVIMAGGSF